MIFSIYTTCFGLGQFAFVRIPPCSDFMQKINVTLPLTSQLVDFGFDLVANKLVPELLQQDDSELQFFGSYQILLLMLL